MGHLARATAVAQALKEVANPIIVSMASGIAEIPAALDIRCEYIPGRDKLWMSRDKWDVYVRDRLLALIEETDAKVLTFDGVVPYPGIFATRIKNKKISLVWIRRGLWQKNLLRYVLPLYSRIMDLIIEPGDIARAFDCGPTSKRKDAVLTSPVSLYNKNSALNREDSRKALGLDISRPVVLVQLGTGDSDVNSKMAAALEGLIGWKDLQVVLTKAPIAKDGSSLAPPALDIKVIRYFPLAKVLQAFDASICATGYNGVHELLPAHIPTVFVSNIRGTDDQEARARWCQESGFALRADQNNLSDITETVKKLQNQATREELAAKCLELPEMSGGAEIARLLIEIAAQERPANRNFMTRFLRRVIYIGIRRITLVYRYLRPHTTVQATYVEPPVFGDSTSVENLRELIKSPTRFEHLIAGASDSYRARRAEIAAAAYGQLKERRSKK
jgi:spore coat polysaccharide biosynthesis predicted glycosyltransferase SpsG